MKTRFLILNVLFILMISDGILAQTNQPVLDQLKLMKELFDGTWQHKVGKDTVDIFECNQFENAFSENLYRVIKEKKTLRITYNWGFSKQDNKFIGFVLYNDGTYDTWIGSFSSKDKLVWTIVKDFNPSIVLGKVETIIDQQKNFTAIFYDANGKKTGEYKWTKIK